VARSLDSESAGARVFLRDGVRGWQGDRNLSADEIDLDQEARRLTARGHVTTRIPRDAGAASAEADYVQVVAERLDYDETERIGVYGGRVRASVTEGWLEADRLEVHIGDAGGVEQILAQGQVRLELRAAGEAGVHDLHVGTGDRLEYDPAERTVRLFGDDAPATVRRLGRPAATTTGRVLHYDLDLGTLQVDPGARSPARIRGS
jgi:lipopolysaccharide transport protein LptA